jgi:PAS domain S-box-containing protein
MSKQIGARSRPVPPDEALYAALDLLPTVIYIADAGGRVEFVNKRFYDVTGIAADAVLARAWADLVHPEDFRQIRKAWAEALATEKDASARYRFRMKDGRYAWVLSLATPQRDENGKVVRWFGTSLDIDPLVRAEQAAAERERELARSEQLHRALGESLNQIVWSADETGWVQWYNRHWYEFTGQTPAEAVGWGWQAVHHAEDFPKVMEAWPHSLATGEPFDMEYRLRGTDGRFRWFLTRAEPFLDESGQIIRWYGTCTDIDEQRRAFERSKHVVETLQDLFLPRTLPERDDVRFSSAFVSAESDALVGGDWYDVVELPSSRILITIGDVVGHGVQASVTAGRLRQSLIAAALDSEDPARLLRKMNQVLRFQEDTIATTLVGILDLEAGRLIYSSAGHPPPIIATPTEEARQLPYGGIPLGVDDNPQFVDHEIALEESDTVLVFYTDGVTEAKRRIEEAERHLMSMATWLAARPGFTDPAASLLWSTLGESQPRDDAAVLVAHVAPTHTGTLIESSPRVHAWRFHSSDAQTARRTRQELMRYLRKITAEAHLFESELIVGELLANTVEHAPGLVQIRLDCSGEEPVLTVCDSGSGGVPGEFKLPADIMNEHGRGLYLVRMLARKLEVENYGSGSEISVTLPVRCAPPQ